MTLCKDLKLQKNVTELKLKNIGTGDFWDCIKSNRMTIFLDWLYESDLFIHYYVMNLFYFSIVDIVDSVITNSDDAMKHGMDYVNYVKSDLYTIAKLDEDSFISLLIKYDYPNIKSANLTGFIKEIIGFINNFKDIEDLHINLVLLIQLLKDAKKKKELVFLKDNTDHLLIEDFAHFYLHPIY